MFCMNNGPESPSPPLSPPQLVSDESTTDVYNMSTETNGAQKSKSKGGGVFGKIGRLFSKKKRSNSSSNNDRTANEQMSNKEISARMAEEEFEQKSTLDILLLGAGGSGKTTVFKQMQKLFHGFIDEKEMEFALEDIRENIMVDIIDLCQYNMALNMNSKKIQNQDTNEEKKSEDDMHKIESVELREVCSRIASLNVLHQPNLLLTQSLSKEIHLLWNNKSMINTWQQRKTSHIMDNTPYFLDKVQEIADDDYVVTFDDYVRLRDTTTGVIHKKFLVKTEHGNYKFNVTDVGGQRSERRKWIKLFDNVNVVVYIMNLAGYDQVLFEDNKRNCLDETLELFASTCQTKAFNQTDWVVFFNKVDIFQEKIKSIPFTVFKANFNADDAHNPEKVQSFIQQEFKNRYYHNANASGQKKEARGQIYFHTTCATDAVQVSEIIKKVQLDIITSAMKKMGYMY